MENTHATPPRFGGDWTSTKLQVLAGYLESYTTALQNKPSAARPFKTAYIDAFAGSGYRDARRKDSNEPLSQGLLFPDLAKKEPQALLEGSARLALRARPRFSKYIFIEQNAERCAALEAIKQDFPDMADDILIHQGDANEEIQNLCSKKWDSRRAVLFLDPYGMQVEWTTIEAIAQTKAIDLWLLFPLGIGVNRLLTRSGEIPESWQRRLNLLLGTEDWYGELYNTQTNVDIFGDERERVVKAKTETIGRYFNNRLKNIFAGVADKPGVLRNSVNNPLYLLCFAVANERGKTIALRIAEHLLKDVR